ncbi:hypothetical protein Glove_33g137 [Diversispora epigaea]|uniref:MD-2-related lipid-recognition domain-containing protein n=1 Tax=Diversispora epigaea TaxID=1348612 RepID=A0A397JHP6_9GLOM|nr:hypothetical protein Glove_33g137 [Diversispora epigaea]
MNQSLILVFILLATLSVVNVLPHKLSKRETQWGQCTDLGGGTYPLLGVTISPDPLVQGEEGTISVSGDFESGDTDLLNVRFYKNLTDDPLGVFSKHVCGGNGLPACPIKPFKVDFIIRVQRRLPNPYFLAVVFEDSITETIYGCALTQVGGGSEESYPIASYPIDSYPIASYPIASYPIASYPIAE